MLTIIYHIFAGLGIFVFLIFLVIFLSAICCRQTFVCHKLDEKTAERLRSQR